MISSGLREQASTVSAENMQAIFTEGIFSTIGLLPPVWFLSSRAKGPRGGCLARLRATRMQRDLDPFATRFDPVPDRQDPFCPVYVRYGNCHDRDMSKS